MCHRASLTVTLSPIEIERCFVFTSHGALLPGEHTFCALMEAWIGPPSQLLQCISGTLHRWKEDFAVMLSCRDYESFPWAFHTLPRIYFMYKFDFLFWRWCLLDHLVQMYAWCLNLSFLDLADDCRNSVGPGVRLGPWSFILIRLAVVFMLLHKCEFIRIEYVKFCVGIKFSKALSLKKLLFIFNWNFFGGNCRFTCSCTKAASEMAGKQRFWFRGG